MENTNRVCLQPGDTIQLSWNPDCSGTADWTIKNVVGEGGSSVCYSAVCKGRKGRLKEFYPVDVTFGAMDDFIFLNRTSEHQLVPVGDGMAERFADMCYDFVGAYETLEKARSDNADSDVLNNYIPTYQVLYGCPGNESKKASVYVWTPDDRHGQGFDAYLSEVREHPDIMPVHKMFNIISTTIMKNMSTNITITMRSAAVVMSMSTITIMETMMISSLKTWTVLTAVQKSRRLSAG